MTAPSIILILDNNTALAYQPEHDIGDFGIKLFPFIVFNLADYAIAGQLFPVNAARIHCVK